MNLGVRVASGLALAVVLAMGLWAGGVILDVVLAVAVGVGLFEFSGLLGRLSMSPPPWLLYPLAGWFLFRALLPADVPVLEIGLGVGVVGGLLAALGLGNRGFLRWAAAVGGALWLGWCLGEYLTLMRWHGGGQERFGLRIVVPVLAAAMVGDTAALLTGRSLGRHPFFPKISPKKTVEGALGGALVTMLVSTACSAWLLGLPVWQGLLLGAAIAVAAQGGDLVESALKRAAGEKDASRLIPGHGGLLDRLDSLVLVGPVAYAVLRIVRLG